MKQNQYYNKHTMNLKQLSRDLRKQVLHVNYQKMVTIYVYTISVSSIMLKYL